MHEEEERVKVGLGVRRVRNERRVKPEARRAGGVFELWAGERRRPLVRESLRILR